MLTLYTHLVSEKNCSSHFSGGSYGGETKPPTGQDAPSRRLQYLLLSPLHAHWHIGQNQGSSTSFCLQPVLQPDPQLRCTCLSSSSAVLRTRPIHIHLLVASLLFILLYPVILSRWLFDISVVRIFSSYFEGILCGK